LKKRLIKTVIIIVFIKCFFIWRINVPTDTNAEGIYKWKLNIMTKKHLIAMTKEMPAVIKLRECCNVQFNLDADNPRRPTYI